MNKKKYLLIHADDAGLAWSQNKAIQNGMLQGNYFFYQPYGSLPLVL
jgi:hypothetical protein